MLERKYILLAAGGLGLGLAFGPIKRWWDGRQAEAEIQALTAKIPEVTSGGSESGANWQINWDETPETRNVVNSAAGLGLGLARLAQAEGKRRGHDTTQLDQFFTTLQ